MRISDWSSDVCSSDLTFARKDKASSRADFALRHRCGEETLAEFMLNTVATYPSSLDVAPQVNGAVGPVWRMAPWEIIAFLELKRLGTKLAQHITQLAYYCDSLIRTTPGRDRKSTRLNSSH